MYSARNRNAMITDDTFQIQDWLRSNGNHDRGYPAFDYHHRIRPLSPVKRTRISTVDGKGPDRRRQLKSMESLLGLSDENLNGKNVNSEAVTRASPDVQDSLDRALMDFEETLELAFQSNSIVPPPRGFANHNLGDESNFNKLDGSFESNTTTTGSSGYSTRPDQSTHRSVNTFNELQLVREQMKKSLEIIKDLEEQVKMVPMLKAQVSSLNLEKQKLSFELDKHKKMENIYKNMTGDRQSMTLPNGRRSGGVTTKEVGVNCVPICRDVGVTTPPVTWASASTMTDAQQAATVAVAEPRRPATTAASTQTLDATTAKPPAAPAATVVRVNVATQSPRPVAVRTATVGVTARPRTYDVSVAVRPTSKHVGCSADLTATAVATQQIVTHPPVTGTIQTAPSAVPVTRTTQTAPSAMPVTRTTQTAPSAVPVTRTTQTDPSAVPVTRTTQTNTAAMTPVPVTRTTQTDSSGTAVVHVRGTQTSYPRPLNHSTTQTEADSAGEAHTATAAAVIADVVQKQDRGRPVATTIGRRSNSFHHYTTAAKDAVATSKIPRPKQQAVTPVLNRKVLVRQDTYTKSEADESRPRSIQSLSSTPEIQNGLPESDMNFKPIQDEFNKSGPSKEMRGALKVLNDSLRKTSATLLPRAQLKQAIDIVREEWFKVTSASDCGGHVVKNYVNSFTSYSPVLLEFIVNMTDAAGNTVLHYAISHGNFDVVSAILDTGICNVNLTNDAGYSSVMLVSLAEIKNDDELKIIRRLFRFGDVNLQAKKHGQTTLMLAVSHGKAEVVKLLLECGADLNVQDEDGSTALMCAAEHGLQEVVNILLSCPECDVSIADNDGSTALSIAMEAGHKEIGIALYAKQHILSRENSPFNLSKTKRSRSANTVMPSNMTYSQLSLKKSPSLQPREYATLSSMLKTRNP